MTAWARHTDPMTSHEAAASVTDVTATQIRLLELLKEHGAMTDGDLASVYATMRHLRDWPAVSPSGLRTRRAELVAAGLVRRGSTTQRTAYGRQAHVWEAVSEHADGGGDGAAEQGRGDCGGGD